MTSECGSAGIGAENCTGYAASDRSTRTAFPDLQHCLLDRFHKIVVRTSPVMPDVLESSSLNQDIHSSNWIHTDRRHLAYRTQIQKCRRDITYALQQLLEIFAQKHYDIQRTSPTRVLANICNIFPVNVENKRPTKRVFAAFQCRNGVAQTDLVGGFEAERRVIHGWFERLDTDGSLVRTATDTRIPIEIRNHHI